MDNNTAKNFYLICQEDGIVKLDTKADIARIVLAAKNNRFDYSETELVEMFNKGKDIFFQEKEDQPKNEDIEKTRSKELLHIKTVKEFAWYTGSDKPISVLVDEISRLQYEINLYEKQKENSQNIGKAIYKAGEIKEKDWAILGGVASGIAGGAAGLATALDIQQQNVKAREHNQQLMSSIVKMQMDASFSIDETIKKAKERIDYLRTEIKDFSKKLVEELSMYDLLAKLNPRVVQKKYTETGALELTVETQPTPGILIYDDVNATVDGSFKALVVVDEEIVGDVIFVLPFNGSIQKNSLHGYCIETEKFKNKEIEIVFVPINLWAIETYYKVPKINIEVNNSLEYKNNMIYFSAKDILMNPNIGVAEYENAIKLLESISDWKNAKKLVNTYIENRIAFIEKNNREFKQLIEQKCVYNLRSYISVLGNNVAVLKANGTVVIKGYDPDFVIRQDYDVRDWKNIVSISSGGSHLVGLKTDGTVLATGFNPEGQCNVSKWTDIISISASRGRTVGLKKDGTVVETGYQQSKNTNVANWKDILAVSAGASHTVGLKTDGTVVAAGSNSHGECDVSKWSNIVSISAGLGHTVGIKKDGKVVAVGNNSKGQCNVHEWTDIVKVFAGMELTIGLKKDGTVIATGYNSNNQCDVLQWEGIVDISNSLITTIGLNSAGSLVVAGATFGVKSKIESINNILMPPNSDSIEKLLENEKRNANVCRYCGSEFEGLFSKKCTGCGKKKDY